MHNAAIATLGLNWRYLAFDVDPKDLAAALGGAKAMGFIGVNLTVPHKLIAMNVVDRVDDAAKIWGAVNTVRFEGRLGGESWRSLSAFETMPSQIRSCGFNTDADAIVQALKEDLGLKLTGARLLLLGAGGAGRTAALRLAMETPAELFIVNRTDSKAEQLAGEIRQASPKLKVAVGYPGSSVDLVLNATTLGLKENDPLPFDGSMFSLRRAGAVYDMIYRPAETALLKSAKAAGCRVANGLGMLLYQGAKALELWSGQTAPLEAMRTALKQNVYGND